MKRVYENRGHWWRQTLSTVAVILVAVYGVWEIWSATTSTGEYYSPFGEMLGIGDDRLVFGVIFLGGGVIALWQLITDSADTVTTFDVDEATGISTAALWRPFWMEKLAVELSRIRNWRLHVKIGKRNAKTLLIYADHPGYPRPLQFDLRRADLEGLRRIAPEAVAEYETAAGPKASR